MAAHSTLPSAPATGPCRQSRAAACSALLGLLLWAAAGTAVQAQQPAASSASAEQCGTAVQVYLFGGPSQPARPNQFRDFWHTGYNVGLGGGVRPARWGGLELGATLSYHQFDTVDEAFLQLLNLAGVGAVALDGLGYTALAVGAQVRYHFDEGAWFRPFVFVGAGGHRIRIDAYAVQRSGGAAATGDEHREGALSAAFGAGLSMPVAPPFQLFVEGAYTAVFTQDVYAVINVRDETTFYFPLRLGVVWRVR